MTRRLTATPADPSAPAAQLGEGPAWDAAGRRLIWIDILGGLVHFADASGVVERTVEVGTHVGAALPAADGGLLLAIRGGFATLDAAGTVTPLLDVLADRPDLRFNDAKCDPRGRAFAGTMSYDEASRGEATLYRLEDGPVAAPVFAEVSLSNGLGWSPDGATMYYVDTPTQRITAFDYDLENGTPSGGRLFAEVPADQGVPDGMCVDERGGVWVAVHGGSAVLRHTPDGRLDTVVELPVEKATSCAFGGPDGDILFITATTGLYTVRPGVAGAPATPWQPVSAG